MSTSERVSKPSSSNVLMQMNESATEILPLADGFVEKRQLDDLVASLKRANQGIFRLAVMGEVKKGKSSFINALLGESKLLPTSTDIATSTVFKVMYGPARKHKVFFLADPESGAVYPPRKITRDQLIEYGTEDGNPNNEKRVDFIGIELPSPLLETGLVIIDTPGVGGLFKAHRDITWRFAPNADGIIFVLDSVEAVISADEVNFLKYLTSKYTKRLFFVQTKIDNASELQWKGWEERNGHVLTSEVGIPKNRLFYFPVSAKLKELADDEGDLEDLNDSGYPTLMRFINGKLIPAKEVELVNDATAKMLAISSKVRSELSAKLLVAKETTVSRLQEIESERRRSIERFTIWEREQLQPTLSDANERLNRCRRDSLDRIDELLNPSGRWLLEFVQTQSARAGAEIQQCAGVIQQDFMELCGTGIGKVFDAYLSEYGDVCANVVRKLGVDSSSYELRQAIPEVHVDYRRVDALPMSAYSGFETARSIMFGGLGGMAIANVALSMASMAFPPLAGLNIVVWAAGLYGAAEVKRLAEERRKDEAINKLKGLLSEQLSQIRRSVIRNFEDKADQCSKSLQEVVKSAADQTKRNLERQLEDAKMAGSRTAEDAKKLTGSLEQKLKRLSKATSRLRQTSRSANA